MKSFVALSVLALLFLSACKKYTDVYPPAPFCRIIKIVGALGGEYPDSLVIAYNNKGNPVSLIRTETRTGGPSYYLRYDPKGRLTDLYGIYNNSSSFETWHRYRHDGQGRIVLDSVYMFGVVGPDYTPQPDPNRGYVSTISMTSYAYDHQDRMIRATDTAEYDKSYTTRLYIYNAAGNIEKVNVYKSSGDSSTIFYSYDNKINYRLTNAVWQFADRDYSVNNAQEILTYNHYGLPTLINYVSHMPGHFLSDYIYGPIRIDYDCK